MLIGEETERPYERPPLSKGYLLGKGDKAKLYIHEEAWYPENSVELYLGRRVTSLDLAGHQVNLDSGDRFGYRKLLLATGASPRRLNLPGADLDGVCYLRRIADSERLREAIRGGGRVVVVGAGWIGLETAAAAREYGCEVTIVEPQSTPLQAAFGPGAGGDVIGGFFAQVHRQHGVDVRLGSAVTEFRGTGHVTAVINNDGHQIPADVVIVGVGARPNTELAEHAGLTVDNGVLVDAALRTGAPDVYAAGDIANAVNPRYQGFTGWFPPGGYDALITRGDLPAQAFHAFWLADDRVVAGLHVNRWDEGIAPVQDLIRSGVPVDRRRLADPAIPLADTTKNLG